MATFEEFRQEWLSNPKWWFKATPEIDLYLSCNYSHLLDSKCEDVTTQIIVYDQLSRHVYRQEYAQHILHYFLEKAIILCKNYSETDSLDTIPWIFHMLPLRHTQDPQEIRLVMHKTWLRLNNCIDEDRPLLKRFLKATYQRCPLDRQCSYWTYHTSTMGYSHFYKLKNISNHRLVKTVLRNIKEYDGKRMVLSISGGVDSMVLSVILKLLQPSLSLDIIGVMINYANRQEADDEEAFVISWCCNVLGIPLITRKINEIQRDPCRKLEMRELYETYTRNVRYACYKQAFGESNPLVLLAHHNDDCIENILTNIVQQKKFDNLTGMSVCSITDNITFLRPLLEVGKKEIYVFADTYQIPHLPDSTVSWCQRGIIRDKIRPALQEWDQRCVSSFFETSQVMTELFEIVKVQVNRFKQQCIETSRGVWELHIMKELLPTSKIFWRSFIYELTSIHVSRRSLLNFIEKLSGESGSHKRYIELHKEIRVCLEPSKIIIQYKCMA